MAIKLCHHIKQDGIWCRSAALQGRDYCYFHLTYRGRRMRVAQHRARQQAWRLELPPLEDLNAVQVGIMQVLDAITEHRIARHDAGHLLYGLQTAASNLRGKEGRVSFEVDPSAENRCVSYDSFEEDFELTDDETTSEEKSDSAAAGPPASAEVALAGVQAQAGTPVAGNEAGEPVAARKETATESAGEEAPSPIVIDRLMAVADDGPADSPAGPELASGEAPDAPRKLPRGLRPPNAVRQSPEEAAALAKEYQGTAEECGRLDNGEIMPCRKCEVHLWKRLAQYWEGSKHPPDWLPTTGGIDCLDCQLKHLTTLGRHLDEPMPPMFELYIILKRDGGEDPGSFDNYFWTLRDSITRTGEVPEPWAERVRNRAERDRDSEDDAAEAGNGEEETEASA
ncbi:MAG TPA: hypothetical protein VKG65_04985 [Terriglobales bacterium]|nr:hypothetical protein [Terriglobales bacterium]